MEYEISDHETLPSEQRRSARFQRGRTRMMVQTPADTRADRQAGLIQPVEQMTG